MAEVEILASLDIDKLLNEMRLLQKKNTHLHKFCDNVDEKVDGIHGIHE